MKCQSWRVLFLKNHLMLKLKYAAEISVRRGWSDPALTIYHSLMIICLSVTVFLNNILSPHCSYDTSWTCCQFWTNCLCLCWAYFQGNRLLGCQKCESCTETFTTHFRGVPKLQTPKTHQRRIPQVSVQAIIYLVWSFDTWTTNQLIWYILGFPGVIGCIDGTQIPITTPSVNEGDYVNRKAFHSINVQVGLNSSL